MFFLLLKKEKHDGKNIDISFYYFSYINRLISHLN